MSSEEYRKIKWEKKEMAKERKSLRDEKREWIRKQQTVSMVGIEVNK